MRVLSGKEICAIREKHGFTEVRRHSSHIIMQRRSQDGTTTVPVPDHKAVRIGTLRSIIRQSGLPRSEFESYYLISEAWGGSWPLVGSEVMAAKKIPADVQQRAAEVVERFNQEVLRGGRVRFVPRFKGAFLYLDRQGAGAPGPICRLKYTGSFDAWEFAIFKYSSMNYDAKEWMFPGSQFINGTIEGALKAGMEAYPARSQHWGWGALVRSLAEWCRRL